MAHQKNKISKERVREWSNYSYNNRDESVWQDFLFLQIFLKKLRF